MLRMAFDPDHDISSPLLYLINIQNPVLLHQQLLFFGLEWYEEHVGLVPDITIQ